MARCDRDHDPADENQATRTPPSPSRSRRRRDHNTRRHPRHTPARTQLDLAGVLQRHQLQHAINEAERLRLPGAHTLTQRHPTKKGTGTLRALAPPTHTRTDLEARFTTFLNDRRFPASQTNVVIEGFEVDAAWPDRKLIVELDGYEYHQTRQAFEADRRRDRILAAAGWRVIRITWRDLDDPESLARELEALGARQRSRHARMQPNIPPVL